jgi:hypothetical protein
MDVEKARTITIDKYPVLVLTIDGKEARLGFEQKLTLLEKYNVVFLGPDFENEIQVTIPEAPELGQPEAVLRGFTDDPTIVQTYRDWLAKYE